mgnify:CR=1 FL=1
MYKHLQYQTAEGDMILAVRDDDSMVVIEPDSGELWALASSGALGKVAKYTPPPEPSADELLASERDAMKCSTAQMALAMLDAGVNDAIFAVNAKSAIIWQKATHITRRGPILDAMLTAMNDTAVDDLFRVAMQTRI